MAEGISTSDARAAAPFSVSDTGSLVYITENAARTRVLVWVDRQGTEEVLKAEPRFYHQARIAPDGNSVALGVLDPSNIWRWDFARETMTRLTFALAFDGNPVWTPDGRRLVFSSRRDGAKRSLYWKAADGTGAVERLTDAPSRHYPNGFTSDGNRLLYDDLRGPKFTPANYVWRSYDISPDGKRFLTIRESSGETARAELNLVLNWFEELERLVPTEP